MFYRNTKEIKQSESYSMSFNGREARLLISSTTQESSGSYKIVVTSEGGKDESSAELTVEVRNGISLIYYAANKIFHSH